MSDEEKEEPLKSIPKGLMTHRCASITSTTLIHICSIQEALRAFMPPLASDDDPRLNFYMMHRREAMECDTSYVKKYDKDLNTTLIFVCLCHSPFRNGVLIVPILGWSVLCSQLCFRDRYATKTSSILPIRKTPSHILCMMDLYLRCVWSRRNNPDPHSHGLLKSLTIENSDWDPFPTAAVANPLLAGCMLLGTPVEGGELFSLDQSSVFLAVLPVQDTHGFTCW